MELSFLTGTPLFHGLTEEETAAALKELGAYTRRYEKDEQILRPGEPAAYMGLVLSGSVHIESCDVWGGRSLLGRAGPGELFAETYACLPDQPMLVGAAAAERSEILFLSGRRLLNGGPVLTRNLLQISMRKNLGLSRRIFHTAPKTIRGRLLSYLSEQARLNGSDRFTIPFDRRQLADYLGVERSALSAALSRLRAEGVLSCERSRFVLHVPQEKLEGFPER